MSSSLSPSAKILLVCTTLATISQSESAENGCVHNFQVWRPDQDVLSKLERLENKCSRLGAQVDQHLARVKYEMQRELSAAQNSTHQVRQELMEYKLADMQLRLGMKDIRLDLMQLKGNNPDVRKTVGFKGQSDTTPPNFPSQSQYIQKQLGMTNALVGQLKNGVGDLKAEWLLIKRDMQNMKSEALQLRSGYTNVKDSISKVKSLMEDLQSDTRQLKNYQSQLSGENEKIQKSASEVRREVYKLLNDKETSGFVAELRLQAAQLQAQVGQLERRSTELQRDLMAAVLAAGNGTKSTMDILLEKLARLHMKGNPRVRNPGKDVPIPKDCHDIYQMGLDVSSVYQIRPDGISQLDNVYCEMLNGSGWTVLQRRVDGTLNFDRGWLEYKNGFGNLYGEFWMGNEWFHRLTSQGLYKLRVDIWDWEGQRAYEEYDFVRVDSELTKYRLHVRGNKGNAGDSLSLHDGMAFSTEDSDNDRHMRNCAQDNNSGWWFDGCYSSNLNGIYHTGWYSKDTQTFADGVVWYTWKNSEFYSLRRVEMKVKPANA